MKRPEEMHELMMANPAMKELIEANPEITQMMHNKELMATIANLAHNPAMLQVGLIGAKWGKMHARLYKYTCLTLNAHMW